jgi:hypothetical protein
MYYIMTGPTREHSTAVPTYDKWLLLPVNDEGRERNRFGNEEKNEIFEAYIRATTM